MKKNDDAGLLIAALVAIVAVVGLVILFSGSTAAGAVPSYNANPYVGATGMCGCPDGYTAKFTGGHGGLASCVCHQQPGAGPLY